MGVGMCNGGEVEGDGGSAEFHMRRNRIMISFYSFFPSFLRVPLNGLKNVNILVYASVLDSAAFTNECCRMGYIKRLSLIFPTLLLIPPSFGPLPSASLSLTFSLSFSVRLQPRAIEDASLTGRLRRKE